MKKIAFLTFSLLSISSVHAEPYLYESGTYRFKAMNIDECYGLGSSSPMLGGCQDHFKNLSKTSLANSYHNLLSKLTRDKQWLIDAQRKWEEFAQLQCKFEARASESYSRPGKVYFEIVNSCMESLNMKRAAYLDAIDADCAGCVK